MVCMYIYSQNPKYRDNELKLFFLAVVIVLTWFNMEANKYQLSKADSLFYCLILI